MRSLQIPIIILLLLFGLQASAQDYVDAKLGETKSNGNIEVNFTGVKKKTKKGEDLYRVNVTVTNQGTSWNVLFSTAERSYIKSNKSAVAEINFLNATGRGMSATTGWLFGTPVTIMVPYKCKKCPPPKDKDKDPYNHYIKNYVIGVSFQNGASIYNSYNIRVPEGSIPEVRVTMK